MWWAWETVKEALWLRWMMLKNRANSMTCATFSGGEQAFFNVFQHGRNHFVTKGLG